jgi:gamma-aminobutyrate permease
MVLVTRKCSGLDLYAGPPRDEHHTGNRAFGSDSMVTDHQTGGLKQGLKQRHMTLISIGGTIGAGLFVGSGVVIHQAGPAALLSFLLAGVLVMLVMRMLGEMAVARPAVGSFYEYARIGLGDWAGFSVGWLYWYFWVIVVAVEAVAGAGVIGKWLPGAPVWLVALCLLALMTTTNLISVRAFGEFEYWFSSIKVAAIVVFIIVGALYVTGLWHHATPGLHNLTGNGGFAPHGWAAVVGMAVPAVAFFVGVELVTVAASESKEPGRMVARATNSVVVRVLLFYVGSIFFVVTIQPWNSNSVLGSPYVAVLNRLGVPGTADIMNAIVLTAVLSALNSGLYAASRMLFALTSKGHAPQGLVKVTRRGVPVRATLIGTVVALASIAAAYISPDRVFSFLISRYGAVALFVYLLIACAQVRLRRRMEREQPDALTFKMWCFPWLSYLTIAGMGGVIVAMAVTPDTRNEFLLSLLVLAGTVMAYGAMRLVRRSRARMDTVSGTDVPTSAETDVDLDDYREISA